MPEKFPFNLSIIVPAHNETGRIRKLLDAINKYVSRVDFPVETIIVNNASDDDTVEFVKKNSEDIPNLRIVDEQQKGKGYAVRRGILEAKGEYVIFTDADNSTPIEEVDKLLSWATKYDVVIGSRYCEGGKLVIPQPLIRILGSRVINAVIQILAVPGVKDTQCGFKLFSAKSAKEIFSKQTIFGWSFDIEILAIARKLGYKTKEVGITWYDNPHSAVSPIKDGIKMISDSWHVRKNILAGKYRR